MFQPERCPRYAAEVERLRRQVQPGDGAEKRAVGTIAQVVVQELVVQPSVQEGVDGPTTGTGERIMPESVTTVDLVVIEADLNCRPPIGRCDEFNCVIRTRQHFEARARFARPSP